jgi:hypothetical protein
MKLRQLICTLLSIPVLCLAQEDITENSIKIPMITVHGGLHIPQADLKERFGSSYLLGASFQMKYENNFYWGVEGSAIMGADVKEDDILTIITADSIDIIDLNGHTASIRFWQRGAHGQFIAGKIAPIWGPNVNSGLFIQLGLGYLYHKIRIEDIGNQSPQLSTELLKGYDRLCMGLSTSQLIGYKHFSNNHKINFYVAFEFIQAFTTDVRKYDYNAQTAYTDNRLDLLSGIKFGWTFPLYKKSDNRYYYY